jgi:hypothetical protein
MERVVEKNMLNRLGSQPSRAAKNLLKQEDLWRSSSHGTVKVHFGKMYLFGAGLRSLGRLVFQRRQSGEEPRSG